MTPTIFTGKDNLDAASISGETVEVLNSDAEGRLVLGDGVFYANQFQPRLILIIFSAETMTPTIFTGKDNLDAASIIPTTLAAPHISNFIVCIPILDLML
jgi:hypothetical protein